jgi:tetratricopeptide (TPR) repeat protein
MLVPLVAAGVAVAIPDARALIDAGRFGDAQAVLERQFALGARDAQTCFLLGLVALEQRDYPKAITWFRMALVRDPRSARLRLELGRAFYLAKDYANAELQFERALAGNLPPAVQANARRFLDQIRREKRWSYKFSLAVAPDTNISLGSSAKDTIIFGLPFELGTDAKMHSGVGLVGDSSVEFSPRLNNRLRWRTGISIHRSQYKQAQFDDTIASGWSGPQWVGKNVEVSAAATALQRWYGGRPYQQAFGGQLETIFYSGSHNALLLGVSSQYFTYANIPQQSGPVWSASAGIVRIFDPTSSITLLVNAALQQARTRDLTNRSWIVSLSATHDFRGGFTVTVTPTYAFANYEAPDAFFGIARRDRSKELRTTVLNRRATIWRLTPTITYTRIRRRSSINIYNSRQDRVELGFTSTF